MLRDRGTAQSSAPRCVSFCLAILALLHGRASAQERIAVVQPSGEDQALNRSLERVIRTRLGELGVGAEIESSPLGWRDLELAAGCMGEDAECYAVVAAQLEVDELVLASTETAPDDCVLELVRWRAGTVDRRALHEHGANARFAILDDVGPALRELYGLPPIDRIESAALAPPARGIDPTGPVVFGTLGLASAAAGIALVVAFDASRSAWVSGPTTTMHDVDLALDARQRAERELIGAEVMFGVAAAALVTATVWLIVELTGRHDGDRAALETGWRL